MEWHEVGGVEWVEASLPGARAVFSTRSAGSMKESHWLLADALGVAEERIVSGRQTHGVELAYHDAGTAGTPTVDGHVMLRPGPIGLVYTADCLPVAVAGPGGVAMLHCGWRGLATGIVARGVEAVGATHAAIGPGIGPCCFEVGPEVLAAFAELGGGVVDGRMLDLPEVARRLLRRAGVERIEAEDICTRCEPELFFSHRRDGGPGRQAGLAWIEPGAG
jgi:purine-nucleoside/S-methyl-5'-thioadenosine phosphorylase / adenosine deaminase